MTASSNRTPVEPAGSREIAAAAAEQRWSRHARSTARKLNAGWWLERFAPLAVGIGLVAAVAVLLVRSGGAAVDPVVAAVAGAVSLAAAAVGAYLLARPKFWSEADALVRLEDRLGLHNALTAARCGAGDWPPPPVRAEHGYAWRWPPIVFPLAAAAALVAAAWLIPVQSLLADTTDIAPPPAWDAIEHDLQVLEEEEAADPEAIERFRERIEELKAQPQDEWYSHASLEASDHERGRLQDAVQSLRADLQKSERSLALLQAYSDRLSEAAQERLLAEFAEGLEGLELGELPPGMELAEILQGIDPSQLKALSPAELEALREALAKNAAACAQCNGQGLGEGKGFGKGDGGFDANAWGELSDAELLALVNGHRTGGAPGRGAPTRGPGAAPLSLSDSQSDLGTSNVEPVAGSDLSRSAPGDLIGVSIGDHDLDRTARAPQSGGTARTGSGGEATWEDSLLPAEQAVLKRYFD